MDDLNDGTAETWTVSPQLGLRLTIGLAQGLVAWILLELLPKATFRVVPGTDAPDPAASHALEMQAWPYQHPTAFAVLSMITAIVPVAAIAEVGRMRWLRLALYALVLTAALGALTGYDIWRDPTELNWQGNDTRIWPSPSLILCSGIGTFIVNQLLEHRERGHGLWTAYAGHFEDCWMRGFQLVLALVFTLLVWGVLELGNALFDLIKLDWFGHMIEHNWFRCPVLATAFAASVHISDVRPALLKGMRNLGLTLLAWLLPLVVVLGWGFLAALLFTGLDALWATRHSATILLWAMAVTLVLINAAYKDGDAALRPFAVVRWAGLAASPMMLILVVALAVYAIGLRVLQYGWTPARAHSAMVAAVAAVYACGYSYAAVRQGQWLRGIERINVAASLVILGVLAAKLTPIADPARISVNSQVARLDHGLPADKFDYRFLRFDSGRYGTQALTALTHGSNQDIAGRARLAQANTERYGDSAKDAANPAATEPALSHAKVYPAGAVIPDSLRRGRWADSSYDMPACFRNGSPCDIFVLPPGYLLVLPEANTGDVQVSVAPVLGQDATGRWNKVGTVYPVNCSGVRDALRRGEALPTRPLHDDIIVGGQRLTYVPEADYTCPTAPPPGKVPEVRTTRDASAPAGMGPAFGHPGGL